jgi:hypothetical protein
VGHQAEDAAFGKVVELEGAAAAEGARWNGFGWRSGGGHSPPYGLFTGVWVCVVNYSGGFGGLEGDVMVGGDGDNEKAVKGLRRRR